MDGVKGVAVDRFPWWDHVGVIFSKGWFQNWLLECYNSYKII